MIIGYGFVEFASPQSASLAVQELTKSGVQAQMAKISPVHLSHYNHQNNHHNHQQNHHHHHHHNNNNQINNGSNSNGNTSGSGGGGIHRNNHNSTVSSLKSKEIIEIIFKTINSNGLLHL